jgi:inositol-phosphate phosphatase/L-galactose 1-phosphate phosphatase/histidinol-phosphatase
MNLEEACGLAGEWMDEVRVMLHSNFRAGLEVRTKADASPVTEADLRVEEFLRGKILEHYPEHGFRGEETSAAEGTTDWVWVVDPIDGTRSFASGRPLFTSLLALMQDGIPKLGVIEAPMTGERWVAHSQGVGLFNGNAMQVRRPRPLSEAVVIVSRPGSWVGPHAEFLGRLQTACRWLFFENDAYGYGQLARGDVDLVVERDLKLVDVAAVVPIVQAAGGVIETWGGRGVELKKGEEVNAGSVIAGSCTELLEEVRALGLASG